MSGDPLVAQQAAARVAGAADLLDIRMLHSESRLETTAVPDRLGVGLEIEHEVEHDNDDDALVVRVIFSVVITDASDDEAVAVMRATWAALYELVGLSGEEASGDDFQAFAETSATMTLFPYAREFFTSTSNRLGLPKLVLPTFRLPSPWHPDDEALGAAPETEDGHQ